MDAINHLKALMKSQNEKKNHNTWIKHSVLFVICVEPSHVVLWQCLFVVLKCTKHVIVVQHSCSDQGSRSSSEGQRCHGSTATIRHTGSAATQDI